MVFRALRRTTATAIVVPLVGRALQEAARQMRTQRKGAQYADTVEKVGRLMRRF